MAKKKLEDMTGWKMWEHGFPESRWTVLGPDPNKKRNVYCRLLVGLRGLQQIITSAMGSLYLADVVLEKLLLKLKVSI